MFQRKRRFLTQGGSGCGFMIMTGSLICALLLINGLIVKAFIATNLGHLDVRISQAAQFLFPILMIFAEFYIFDMITLKAKENSSEDPG